MLEDESMNIKPTTLALGGLAAWWLLRPKETVIQLQGFGAYELFPSAPIRFQFDLDEKDFYGREFHQRGLSRLQLAYTPAKREDTDAANAKLMRLLELGEQGSPGAKKKYDDLVVEGTNLTKRIYDVGEGTAWEAVGLGARGEVDIMGKVIKNGVERARIEAMSNLRNWVKSVAALDLSQYQRQVQDLKDAAATQAAIEKDAAIAAQRRSDEINALISKKAASGMTKNAATASGTGSSNGKKIALAVGGLVVLLGIGIAVSKRKK